MLFLKGVKRRSAAVVLFFNHFSPGPSCFCNLNTMDFFILCVLFSERLRLKKTHETLNQVSQDHLLFQNHTCCWRNSSCDGHKVHAYTQKWNEPLQKG